ncbi:serine/threonine protein kinase [Archangium violaceum]|uniref:serine/threonine protein kinase n=1 Tax=Archangium violaceum TaxID=83451 RepID=UPI0006991F07|nr:serine/threonine-protein kinase [Archangium violaceum]
MFTNHEGVTVHPDALAPGTEVGNWRVVERLGVGGYGAVYRVEDMARVGDFYALKVALYAGDERAEREVALLLTKGEHPNVVRFHGCARWPHPKDGLLVFVMDLVPGLPLHLWAETLNGSFRQLAEAGGKMALAVGTLHERGVFHRDLKPEHIIIRESDGEPVLLDFGAGWFEGADPLTTGTLPPGTLLMRSPESIRFLWNHYKKREARYPFQRTDDLYALGVCLYRAATGHYPFPEGMADLTQYAIVHQQPPSPRDFNRRVPRALSDLIMRLLAKKPEERYQRGVEVHEALMAAVAFGDPKQWEASIFEWEEVAPEKDGDEPRRRIRRPACPTQSMTPPPPRLVIPPPLPPLHPPRRGRGRRGRGAPEPEPSGRAGPGWTDARRRLARGVGSSVLGGLLVIGGALLLMTVLGVGPLAHVEPLPPDASSPSLPTRGLVHGQEVAPSWPPPEAEWAAAPPLAKATPAVVASQVTRPEDDALKKQQAPQGDTKQKRALSPVAKWCVGAAAAANLACPGAQVRTAPEAQVRTAPEPQPCPAGAVETMTDTLDIKVEQQGVVVFPHVFQHKPVPVREGSTSMKLNEPWGKLPAGTVLQGRLSFGEGHIYGRFTEARTPTGDTFKVCMQIFTGPSLVKRGGGYYKPGPGTEMEPGSTPDNALMFTLQNVEAVERFD